MTCAKVYTARETGQGKLGMHKGDRIHDTQDKSNIYAIFYAHDVVDECAALAPWMWKCLKGEMRTVTEFVGRVHWRFLAMAEETASSGIYGGVSFLRHIMFL